MCSRASVQVHQLQQESGLGAVSECKRACASWITGCLTNIYFGHQVKRGHIYPVRSGDQGRSIHHFTIGRRTMCHLRPHNLSIAPRARTTWLEVLKLIAYFAASLNKGCWESFNHLPITRGHYCKQALGQCHYSNATEAPDYCLLFLSNGPRT